MVAGPNTFRLFTRMLAESTEESEVHEHGSLKCGVCRQPWCPPLLEESLDWPNATLVSGDAVRGGVDRCRRPGWGSGGEQRSLSQRIGRARRTSADRGEHAWTAEGPDLGRPAGLRR